jgi:hypothetical protein
VSLPVITFYPTHYHSLWYPACPAAPRLAVGACRGTEAKRIGGICSSTPPATSADRPTTPNHLRQLPTVCAARRRFLKPWMHGYDGSFKKRAFEITSKILSKSV